MKINNCVGIKRLVAAHVSLNNYYSSIEVAVIIFARR